jgi:Amt family ammonium transporter
MDEAAIAAGGSWSLMQQLGVQVAAVLVAIIYAALLTLIILVIIDKIFGLRSSTESEMKGLDSAYHGEHGYGMLNPN